MDAIFQYQMNYMEEPFKRFDSYMERASLQLRVELEEYVESTINTSSSIFLTEGAKEFGNKLKNAVKLIIERLKEFIQDSKVSFENYRRGKALEKKVDKLASIIGASDKLKDLKVKYKDYSPKAKYIKSQKEAFKRLVRKPGTKSQELKLFMKRYTEGLSDSEKLAGVVTTIAVTVAVSKATLKGVYSGFNEFMEEASKEAKELDVRTKKTSSFNESTKEEILESSDMEIMITRYMTTIINDGVQCQREILKNYENSINEIDKMVKEELKNMEGDE